jgi:hypothetical protein
MTLIPRFPLSFRSVSSSSLGRDGFASVQASAPRRARDVTADYLQYLEDRDACTTGPLSPLRGLSTDPDAVSTGDVAQGPDAWSAWVDGGEDSWIDAIDSDRADAEANGGAR